MDTSTIGKHISQQFNEELEDIRNRVMTMGGLVERQMDLACQAFVERDSNLADEVVSSDYKINAMEVEIDEECSRIIARRQPTAIDLRLLLSVIKTVTDLERIGDETEKVAKMALSLAEKGGFGSDTPPPIGIDHLSALVKRMLRDALDALARMDAEAAIAAMKQDKSIDQEYESMMRQLATYMMEDPRKIGAVMNMIWAARALERVGDHAKNIGEYVIYLVHGKDLRHVSPEQAEEEIAGQGSH